MPPLLLISVDTEEDNWVPCRDGITVENIRELPRLGAELGQFDARPTYFTSYQVAKTDWCGEILCELEADGRAEVGSHLHPWNTPPVDDEFTSRSTFACNLPFELQRAKIASLTQLIRDMTGRRPRSFRAGRWGFDRSTARALLACGYEVDSSVTPFKSWRDLDGPSHVGAPTRVYRLDGREDHRRPVPAGPLIEVPISLGYSQPCWSVVEKMNLILDSRGTRKAGLDSLARRLHLLNHVILNPEMEPVKHMERLVHRLLAAGAGHLHISFHSSTLRPGCNPYARTQADVERFYAGLKQIVERILRLTPVRFATVEQAAGQLKLQESGEFTRT